MATLTALWTMVLSVPLAEAQSAADGFNPTANTYVDAIVQTPDGKIVIGGAFTNVGGQARNYLARLHPDGSLDSTFTNLPSGIVISLMAQTNGQILAGGYFLSIGAASRSYIGRFNSDGSVDTTFTNGADNGVLAIVVQSDGRIVAGGDFTQFGGQARNHLVRLNPDGSVDGTFTNGTDGSVYALAVQSDGKILVGGDFTNLAGKARSYLGRLNDDGSLDASFSGGADGVVYSLAVQPDGLIVVGGGFGRLSGRARSGLGRLYSNGRVDSSFDSDVSTTGMVRTVMVQLDGRIVVGGDFPSLGGQPRRSLGRLNTDGSVDTTFTNGLSAAGDVQAVAQQWDGKLLVGGSFTMLAGKARGNIGRFNKDGSLDDDLICNADKAAEPVLALACQADGRILVGGDFTNLAGVARLHLARIDQDGHLDPTFTNGVNGSVRCILSQPDGKIVVAGGFGTLAGQPRSDIGRLNSDGSLDTAFTNGADNTVWTAELQTDGKILLGGEFHAVAGRARYHLARLNADGSLDETFTNGTDNIVFCLAVQTDGKILLGGMFTNLAGQARDRIGRLNSDGSVDSSFAVSADSVVRVMRVQPNGQVLVGGEFTTIAGQAVKGVARLSSFDGSFDSIFTNGTTPPYVIDMALQVDGKVVVGGNFTKLAGQDHRYLGRLNSDGTLDTTFSNSAGGTVSALSIQSDGKILVAGPFTGLAWESRISLGRLSTPVRAVPYLTASQDTVTWWRVGALPEVWWTTFEQSLDGVVWTSLGTGTRIPSGWQLTGLALPGSGNVFIRARGYAPRGSIHESVIEVCFSPAEPPNMGIPWLSLLLGQ
jgi:uncharacterized delta-60 repeat protein